MKQNLGAAFRFSLSALALGAVVSFASDAAASETFPKAVQEALGTCLPPCTLCHKTLAGGPGNLNAGFGTAIQPHLDVGSPASIPGALDALEAQGTDSDGDGVGDIEELTNRQDPNVVGAGALCDGPTYGCGARMAGGKAHFDWLALLIAGAAGAALVHGVRRRRTRA